MITKNNTADIVVILKTLPVLDAVKTLGTRVVEELIKMEPSNESSLKLEVVDGGFKIINATKGTCARIMITTIMSNFRKIDSNIHVPLKLLQRHMAAIRHMRLV